MTLTDHPSVLVLSGRFPAAIALVRALYDVGARVDVADSFPMSPALHSNRADVTHHTAPPAHEPRRFAEDVADIVRARGIDLVVPSFEEAFFLARYAERVPTPIFAPPFPVLAELHNKARFVDLCGRLGLRTPPTITVQTRAELADAVGQFDDFVARPAFSRGGMVFLTNHGPRAGESSVDDCTPTADNPWLVQPYVEGDDACSFSVVDSGEVLLHCAYEPTISASGGWSLQFATIDDFGSLGPVQRIVGELGYTGNIGFDYRRTDDGLAMIECNPRATAGAFFPSGEWLAGAMLGTSRERRIVSPGLRRQYDAYLLDPHLGSGSPRKIIHELLTTPDAFFTPHDMLPAFYFLLGRRHWHKLAKREHVGVGEAFVEDMSWDGSPMPDPAPRDRAPSA